MEIAGFHIVPGCFCRTTPQATTLRIGQQLNVVGCCPGLQALTIRRWCAVISVDMLAVGVASIQSGVLQCWDGRRCELQGLVNLELYWYIIHYATQDKFSVCFFNFSSFLQIWMKLSVMLQNAACSKMSFTSDN